MLYNESMHEVNPRLKSVTGGIVFSACTVANILVSLIFVMITQAARIDELSDAYKYLSYLAAPIAVSLGCYAAMKHGKQDLRDVVKVKCNPVYYVIAILMIFGLIFSVAEVNTVTLEFLKLLGYTPREESSYLPTLEGGLIVPALLAIAVIPALVEEFFFRGVLLQNARAGMGDIRTIFTVGFCFSIFHASPEQTVYQFICGCAFALLAIRSGSLIPSVLIHFLNNAFIIILYACGYNEIAFSQTADLVLTIVGAIAFISSILWLILIKKPFISGQKNSVSAFYIFAAVGIFINALIWILSFFSV